MCNQNQHEFALTISVYITPKSRSSDVINDLRRICTEKDELRRYEPVVQTTKTPGKVDLRINFHCNSLERAEDEADQIINLVLDSIKSDLGDERFLEGSNLLTYA